MRHLLSSANIITRKCTWSGDHAHASKLWEPGQQKLFEWTGITLKKAQYHILADVFIWQYIYQRVLTLVGWYRPCLKIYANVSNLSCIPVNKLQRCNAVNTSASVGCYIISCFQHNPKWIVQLYSFSWRNYWRWSPYPAYKKLKKGRPWGSSWNEQYSKTMVMCRKLCVPKWSDVPISAVLNLWSSPEKRDK